MYKQKKIIIDHGKKKYLYLTIIVGDHAYIQYIKVKYLFN